MVSKGKRLRYDSESYFNPSDESDETNSNGENQDDLDIEIRNYQSRRKPKCLSRNALMARENRLKKKIYVARLEKQVEALRKDNTKLSSIVDGQSEKLTELKKEVKYLKGVLANSSDISKLLDNIHRCTGMYASTSLNKNLKTPETVPIARKTMHPWNVDKEELTEDYSDLTFDSLLGGENDEFPSFLMDQPDDFNIKTEENLTEHDYTSNLWRYLEGSLIYLPLLTPTMKVLKQQKLEDITSFVKCIVPLKFQC